MQGFSEKYYRKRGVEIFRESPKGTCDLAGQTDTKNQTCQVEKPNKLDQKCTSLDKKVYKSTSGYVSDYKQYRHWEGTSSVEKVYKSAEERESKLPNKKLQYIINILLMLGSPLSVDELMALFDYKHKGNFRENYLKPLETVGFIRKTNLEKPTAANQKYMLTEQGKRFLTGDNLSFRQSPKG